MLARVKAVLWLHTLRLWRYKWSFLNMILSYVVWMLLLMLGILLFVPHELLGETVKAAFWTILAWNIISQFSSLIGGWMRFFISIGMVEEHILRGMSPFKVIVGRVIPSFSMIVMSQLFIAVLLNGMFKIDVLVVNDPPLLALSFMMLMVESLSYGIVIAAISMRTSIPHAMLEILNFAIVGLLMIPANMLPSGLNILYLTIPYIAPAHLMKIATLRGMNMLYLEALTIALIESSAFSITAMCSIIKSEKWIRKNGVKAIGFW